MCTPGDGFRRPLSNRYQPDKIIKQDDSKQKKAIATPLLILHGWDDPLSKPSAVAELASELTRRNADWEINAYGHTGHAFTNPNAKFPEKGLFYSEKADKQSWKRMTDFFSNVFEE